MEYAHVEAPRIIHEKIEFLLHGRFILKLQWARFSTESTDCRWHRRAMVEGAWGYLNLRLLTRGRARRAAFVGTTSAVCREARQRFKTKRESQTRFWLPISISFLHCTHRLVRGSLSVYIYIHFHLSLLFILLLRCSLIKVREDARRAKEHPKLKGRRRHSGFPDDDVYLLYYI